MRQRKDVNVLKIACLFIGLSVMITGCKKEEEIVVDTDYIEGVYLPEDNNYKIELPSVDWVIQGEENSNEISFKQGDNTIEITCINGTYETKEMISELPKQQNELEEKLDKAGNYDCEVQDFSSSYTYTNERNLGLIDYTYMDGNTAQYIIERVIYFDDSLYMIRAITESAYYDEVKNTCKNFIIFDEYNNEMNLSTEPELIKLEGNLYTSSDGSYQISLPYENWEFKPDIEQNKTIIQSDTKKFTISILNTSDYQNKILYEIPRDLNTLGKQINLLNLGSYEIISFYEQSVGMTENYDSKNNYHEYYYLLKLNDNPNGIKYCSVYEYRNENNTYNITAETLNDTIADGKQILRINQSFNVIY